MRVLVNGARLGYVSDTLDESGIDGAVCRKKVAGGWKVVGDIMFLIKGYCMRHCPSLFFCMVVRQ